MKRATILSRRATGFSLSRGPLVLGLAAAAMVVAPAAASSPALRTLPDAQTDMAEAFVPVERVPHTLPAAQAVDLSGFDVPAVEEDEDDGTDIGSGTASFYGRKFHGRRTASGEKFDMNELTAAHRTLPFGTKVRVTNEANGKSVVVRINDRGPFHGNRLIDLSRAAASEIGLVARGSGRVDLARLDG